MNSDDPGVQTALRSSMALATLSNSTPPIIQWLGFPDEQPPDEKDYADDPQERVPIH